MSVGEADLILRHASGILEDRWEESSVHRRVTPGE
jgi:hypothetical protein